MKKNKIVYASLSLALAIVAFSYAAVTPASSSLNLASFSQSEKELEHNLDHEISVVKNTFNHVLVINNTQNTSKKGA